jgi:hypothetical protein
MNDWNYKICQRLFRSSALLLFSPLLLTTHLFLLYPIHLHLFYSQVFAEQGTFKSVNVKQTSLHSKATDSNTTTAAVTVNNDALAINSSHLKAKSNIATASSNAKVIEKLSDKGMYRVLMRSNQSFNLLPKNGFKMQILFLNPSSISSASAIISSPSSPIIMKELAPVSSFDITIYSNNGKVLWQKTNQTINTATAFEKVVFAGGGYSGSTITIQITNIKPSPVPIGAAIPLLSSSNGNSSISTRGEGTVHNNNNKTPSDSVTFTALVAAK